MFKRIRLKSLSLVLPMAIALVPVSSHADPGGSEVSNGGSYAKQLFQKIGATIIRHFESGGGSVDAATYGIQESLLQAAIGDGNIQLEAGLKDKNGVRVDARVEGEFGDTPPRKITLDQEAYSARVLAGLPIETLVCHEMLRSININDDGSRICGKLDLPSLQDGHSYALQGEVVRVFRSMLENNVHAPGGCEIRDTQTSTWEPRFVVKKGEFEIIADFHPDRYDYKISESKIAGTRHSIRTFESSYIEKFGSPDRLRPIKTEFKFQYNTETNHIVYLKITQDKHPSLPYFGKTKIECKD